MTNPNPDAGNGNPDGGKAAVDAGKAGGEGGKTGNDAGKADATIMGGDDAGGGDGAAAKPVGDWPSDWRNKLAGDDADTLKQLGNFKSPADLHRSYRALQQKLSSGEYKKPVELPENATAEQLTAYRKEMGVPETAEGYSLDFGDGLVVGEEDKPIVMDILKDVHAAHVPDKYAKPILSAYFKRLEAERAAQIDADQQTWQETEDALRGEYGNEYRVHKNALSNYLKTLPEEFQENLIGARLADGRKLLGTVDGIKLVMSLAKEANPVMTVVKGGGDPAQSIEDELKSLGVGTDAYWADPAKQKRAGELYVARDRLKAKAG